MSGQYAAWLYTFVALCFTFTLQTKDPWGKIQRYPANKIPDNALSPQRSIVRRKIVLYHNFFRSKVQPTASNMLLMTWHEGAARQAQEYAEKCKFLKHNPLSDRNVPNLNSCGQNLFVAAQKTPWFFVLKNWFVEYQNFTYGYPIKDLKPIGHYTQMVWATSHKLGCGFAKCTGGPWGHFYNYVCHYCPGGNYENKTHYPYKTGKKCGDCPNDCVSDSLCSNTCPVKDFYANCGELFKITNSICQQGTCNATCLCGDKKIYKEYPWN